MLKSLLISFTFLLFMSGCGSSTTSNSESKLLVSAQMDSDVPLSINQKIVLNFSTDLNATTVNSDNVYILDLITNQNVGAVLGFGTPSSDKIIITPYRYFNASHTYKIVLTSNLKGVDGSSLSAGYELIFSTLSSSYSDTLAPVIKTTKPQNGDSGILVGSDIVIEFDEMISSEAQYIPNDDFKVTDGDGVPLDGTVEVFNSLMKFIPLSDLPYDSNITVEFTSSLSVEDMYGNSGTPSTTFSFQTRTEASSPKSDLGFKSLSQLSLNKSATTLSTLKNSEETSIIAVATENAAERFLEIYEINYASVSGFPEFSQIGILPMFSKITSMVSYLDRFLLVGTISDGVLVIEVNTTSGVVVQRGQFLHGESIYGVRVGASQTNVFDRAYAVGPELGLQIFDLNNTTGALTLGNETNSSILGTALDVQDVTSYDSVAQRELRKLYIADYNGSVVSLDENGTFLQRTDINGSVKKIALHGDYNGALSLMAVCSSGSVQGVDFNGSVLSDVRTNLLGNTSDVSLLSDMYSMSENIYYSLGTNGVEIANGDYVQEHIKTVNEVISTDIISKQGIYYSSNYLVTLSSNGVLEIYNALFDDVSPQVYTVPYSGAIDVPVDTTIEIDINEVYLNHATLIAENFTIKDDNTSTLVPFTLGDSLEFTLSLVPDNNLSFDHHYTVVISSEISDLLGNKLADGVDQNISFTTVAQ
ncbi:MAG: Ig-like domain-containing protein [Campylobacterota bacterium]|nr:Ig-like domain-containing protein [Campylobacterota bacterium]